MTMALLLAGKVTVRQYSQFHGLTLGETRRRKNAVVATELLKQKATLLVKEMVGWKARDTYATLSKSQLEEGTFDYYLFQALAERLERSNYH